jgi:hypothetical protein
VTVRASSTHASTDRVDGRSTAAVTLRVATSIMAVSSTRPGVPSSSSTSTSSGVESICISSPGAAASACPNGGGRAASDWRARADPVMCRPRASVANSRYNVRRDGSATASPCSARTSSAVRHSTKLAVRDDEAAASSIAARIAATTRSSVRPVTGIRLSERRSASPSSPPAWYFCRMCLTVRALASCPAAVSSAAFARSRLASDSPPAPSGTSRRCRSHHSARSAASGASASSFASCGSACRPPTSARANCGSASSDASGTARTPPSASASRTITPDRPVTVCITPP